MSIIDIFSQKILQKNFTTFTPTAKSFTSDMHLQKNKNIDRKRRTGTLCCATETCRSMLNGFSSHMA